MIRIAIQSKGRLNEQSVELLQDAGLNVNDQKRKFLDRVDNFPVEILYLRDDDIPEVVADGSADIGIVGYNEVAETEAVVNIVRQLGFGGCRISLAIPKADEYTSPQYFQGKSIATSYPNILRRFLAEQGVDASVRVIKGSVDLVAFVCTAEQCSSSISAVLDKTHIYTISLKVILDHQTLFRKVKVRNRECQNAKIREYCGYVSTGISHAFRNHRFNKLVTLANDKAIGIFANNNSIKSKVSAKQTRKYSHLEMDFSYNGTTACA